MNTLPHLLSEAMRSENPTLAFRDAIKEQVDQGAARDSLIADLEVLRKSANDREEDVILEVMDFLRGWCAPQMKI